MLYDQSQPTGLKKALQWAIEHPREMADFGMEAYRYVKQVYKPEDHYEQLMGVFEKVIRIHRGR